MIRNQQFLLRIVIVTLLFSSSSHWTKLSLKFESVAAVMSQYYHCKHPSVQAVARLDDQTDKAPSCVIGRSLGPLLLSSVWYPHQMAWLREAESISLVAAGTSTLLKISSSSACVDFLQSFLCRLEGFLRRICLESTWLLCLRNIEFFEGACFPSRCCFSWPINGEHLNTPHHIQ